MKRAPWIKDAAGILLMAICWLAMFFLVASCQGQQLWPANRAQGELGTGSVHSAPVEHAGQAISDAFMARLEQRESGGRNVAGRDGERGVCQMTRAAWEDVNRWRKARGLPVRPFDDAWIPEVNREFARQFCEIQSGRLRAFLRREASEAEIYRAYQFGFAGFKRWKKRNT